jgi:hypothetical protein
MPEDRSQESEARNGFWFGIFFRLSINEAGLDVGTEVVLTSGSVIWLLQRATVCTSLSRSTTEARNQKPE